MSISVGVVLLSGSRVSIQLDPESRLEALRTRAEAVLGTHLGKLITAAGALLTGQGTLRQAGIRDGDTITAVAGHVAVAATASAFALIRADGSVVTWGDPSSGGNSKAVQHQLQNVREIQANTRAFAALREDGSVVTWGHTKCGGCSQHVQRQLHDVRHMQASSEAFAAIKADGSVVAWGDTDSGGSCEGVQEQLKDVASIQASDHAFAALRADGVVVTWGDSCHGGDSYAVRSHLRHVLRIHACWAGFAAIKAGGQVVYWGTDFEPGMRVYETGFQDIQQLEYFADSLVAVGSDGRMSTWGKYTSECQGVVGKGTLNPKVLNPINLKTLNPNPKP